MEQVWVVEYRWSDMKEFHWRHIFNAESEQAVLEELESFRYMESLPHWSKTWRRGEYTYLTRRFDNVHQTARYRLENVIQERSKVVESLAS